jgi:HK97 family phage prohead protease/HK97 family phage major capsid protein
MPDVHHRSVLEFRAATNVPDGDDRTWVSGHAVAWDSRNSYGETFVPGAFDASLTRSASKPLPIRWMHRTPIGVWERHANAPEGLEVSGPLSDTATVRDEALPLLRDGAVTGLSVGFMPRRWKFVEAGESVTFPTPGGDRSYTPTEPTIYVLEADLMEVSLVDMPSDDDARLTEVRDRVLTRARELGSGDADDLSPAIRGGHPNDAPRRVTMSADTSAPQEALDSLVRELRETKAQIDAGQQDFSKAVAIMSDLQARMVEADKAREVTGYVPGDTDDTPVGPLRTRAQRAQYAVEHGTKRAAVTLGRPEADIQEFQQRSDELVLLSSLLKVDPRSTTYYKEQFLPALRALDSTTATEGDEWVPTELSSMVIERINLPLRVAGLFPTITMPTQPYDIPGMAVSRVRGGKAVEQTADTGQTAFKKITPGTRKITLTAGKFAATMLVSKELEEDSLIPVMPFMQQEILDFLAADIEDCILNGDGTGGHQDSDVTDADDPRRVFDGLRVQGLAQAATRSDASSASKMTVAILRAARAKMGKYGLDLGNLATVMGINSFYQLLDDTSVVTVDKFGSGATVLTGQLGAVDGVPIIVSEYVRQNLNASGVYDNVTTTETYAVMVHRLGFLNGVRRQVSTQWLRENYAEYDQDALLVTHRRAFAARYPIATEPTLCVIYNVDA